MAAAARRTYVTFDVPGGSLTDPTAINWVGTIVGYYFDPRFVPHSFVRYPGGALIPFDPPGATGGSVPFGIDPEGTIAGQSCDATTCHGFLRYAGGSFVTFDPPAATYTNPIAINAFGTIAGYYCDASACHGFLRDPAGAFVVFDPPGPIYTGEFAGGGANVIGVNAEGAITGAFCSDPNCNGQSGFVRTHSGAIATFDPQGSLATSPSDINVAGAIAGYYRDVNRVFHGFLRAPSGAIIAFDPPTSTIQTTACCITWTGTIVGSYIDPSSFDFHGYLRTWNGAFTVFDPPGSLATIPVAINAVGTVTGQFCDATTCHGFVRNR